MSIIITDTNSGDLLIVLFLTRLLRAPAGSISNKPFSHGSSVSSHYQSHRGSMQNQLLLSHFNPFIATISVEMWLKESNSYPLFPFPDVIRFYKVWDSALKLRHFPEAPRGSWGLDRQIDNRRPIQGHLALPYTGLGTRHPLSKSQHGTDLLTNLTW